MHPLEKPVVSASEAVSRIPDGAGVAVGGAGAGHALPDILLRALGERFRATKQPTGLTLIHPFGVGNQAGLGLEHVALPEMYRRVIGGHWSLAPTMAKLAAENAFPAYCLPAGVMVQLFRCAAAGSPGWMTHVGLETFVDPRREGGRLNEKASETLVELTQRDGREWLFYPTIPIDVALVHAWKADRRGNLSMAGEAGVWHNLQLAQAARVRGGLTIAVVRELVESGALDPREVRTPGAFVDLIVVDPDHGQTFQTEYEPAWTGEARLPPEAFPALPFNVRKAIARRASRELTEGAVLNVGFGLPDGVIAVARETGLDAALTTTIEHGQFGGVPAGGLEFGAVYNPEAIITSGEMFDFYHGRGVDQTYLGFLQIDRAGNVNVSKLGDRIIGVGGFIDISQKARKAVFCGTLSVKAEVEIESGRLRYARLGKPKLVERVAQVTFSGDFARREGQEALYVTEAAVFRLQGEEIVLEEVAPGVDLERDVYPQMGFRPRLAENVRTMDEAFFRR